MVRWRYRGTTVFFIGVLVAAFAFTATAGSSLLASAGRRASPALAAVFHGDLLVRHPSSAPFADAVDGAATRPLADAPACRALLRADPAVAHVLPFSLARVDLKSSPSGRPLFRGAAAVAVPDDAWLLLRARLAPDSAGLPRSLESGIVFDERMIERLTAGGSAPSAADREIFIDRPGARDPLNVAAVTFAGSYTLPGARANGAADPVCFVSPASLLKAAWQSPADLPRAAKGPAAPALKFIAQIDPGVPLDYPFLFSLSTPRSAGEPPDIPPAFLLVSLGESGRGAAVRAGLERAFARQGLLAVIEHWEPAGARAAVFPWRFGAALAAWLIAMIVIANASLRPVLTGVLPERGPGGGFGLGFWRPSFLSQSLRVAFLPGALGILLALGTILAYDGLVPAGVRETLGAFLPAGSGPVGVSWTGVGLAAAGVVLFALLSGFGPRRRAKKIVRTLTAGAEKKGPRP